MGASRKGGAVRRSAAGRQSRADGANTEAREEHGEDSAEPSSRPLQSEASFESGARYDHNGSDVSAEFDGAGVSMDAGQSEFGGAESVAPMHHALPPPYFANPYYMYAPPSAGAMQHPELMASGPHGMYGALAEHQAAMYAAAQAAATAQFAYDPAYAAAFYAAAAAAHQHQHALAAAAAMQQQQQQHLQHMQPAMMQNLHALRTAGEATSSGERGVAQAGSKAGKLGDRERVGPKGSSNAALLPTNAASAGAPRSGTHIRTAPPAAVDELRAYKAASSAYPHRAVVEAESAAGSSKNQNGPKSGSSALRAGSNDSARNISTTKPSDHQGSREEQGEDACCKVVNVSAEALLEELRISCSDEGGGAQGLVSLLKRWAAEAQRCLDLRETSTSAEVPSSSDKGGKTGSAAPRNVKLEDENASTVPMDAALRQSEALELALNAVVFDLPENLLSEVEESMFALMGMYLYGSQSVHRAILAVRNQLDRDDEEKRKKEDAAARILVAMLKHALREASAFFHGETENRLLLLSSTSDHYGAATVACSAADEARDTATFRVLSAATQERTLRLAVFRGFSEQLHSFAEVRGVESSLAITSLIRAVDDELYDSIAAAQQEVAAAWQKLVACAIALLTAQLERVRARVSSLELDVHETEQLGDLREVLRRVTQLSKAHEAVLRYCLECCAETNRVVHAFYTLFNLVATIHSGLDVSSVSQVSEAARRMSALSKELVANRSILALIALVQDAAEHSPSELMGMGNKTARALRFEASPHARRHARMKSSPDELLNMQIRLSETMTQSDDDNVQDSTLANAVKASDKNSAAQPQKQRDASSSSGSAIVSDSDSDNENARKSSVLGHDKTSVSADSDGRKDQRDAAKQRARAALVPLSSPPRRPRSGTPGKSPMDKLSAQHYRSRSVEEIIFFG